MKVILINGMELHTESDADVERLLKWAAAIHEPFSVPSTHSGLRTEEISEIEALGELVGDGGGA